ncbi:MAG: HAD family hydrolase [Acidobacteriota bacterium]
MDQTMYRAVTANLLIDADDTLWENNIYFERVIEEYLLYAEALGLNRSVARETLNAVERKNTVSNGYGVRNFIASLKESLSLLLGSADGVPVHAAAIDRMALPILDHPIEFLDGVQETLRHLHARHRTILFTKGDREEQGRKIDESGVKPFFHATEIVREKDPDSFQQVMERHGLDPSRTWMIGNSPKSDINPALAVGMGAIFIPHHRTWDLEKEEVATSERVLVLRSFSQLLEHF